MLRRLFINLSAGSRYREHYSDIYVKIVEELFNIGTTVILVAPTGTGKTFSMARLVLDIVSGRGRIVEVCRKVTSIHIAVPTHATLSDFASKLTRSFESMINRGHFYYRMPRLFILRGSIYSCPDEERRNMFRRLMKEMKNIGLTARLGLELMRMLDTGQLGRRDVKSLIEYAMLSEIELSMSYICSTCPRRGGTRELLKFISESNIAIIDTEAESSKKLLEEASQHGVDPEKACPYRAVLHLLFFEPSLRDLFTSPHIICTTHALKMIPEIAHFLNTTYGIVGRSGRTMPHIDIIDEVDMPILSPPKVRAPIYFASGHIDASKVRKVAVKYVLPDRRTFYEAKKLIDLCRELYTEIRTAINTVSPHERVMAICRAVLKNFEKACQLHGTTLSRCRSLVKRWREGIANRLAKGDTVDVEDVATYVAFAKLVDFYTWVRRMRLSEIPLDRLAERIMLGIGDPDISAWFLAEFDPRLGIGRVHVNDLAIPLLEHAVKMALSPTYPYAVRGKIGLTATLSLDWLSHVLTLLSPPDREELERSIINIADAYVNYRNVHFYKAVSWMPAEYYAKLHRGEIRGEETELLERLKEYVAFGARKRYLETVGSFGLKLGLDVTLNQICEILSTCRHVDPILVIYGTKSQMMRVVEALRLGQRRRYPTPIGMVEIVKVDYDRENNVGKCIAKTRMGTTHLDLIYARGKLGRGVDLEQYNAVYFASPPIKTPMSVKRYVGVSPLTFPLSYIDASIAIVQATFRVVRRVVYRTPKHIFLDITMLVPAYIDNFPTWFKHLINSARETETVRRIRMLETA